MGECRKAHRNPGESARVQARMAPRKISVDLGGIRTHSKEGQWGVLEEAEVMSEEEEE